MTIELNDDTVALWYMQITERSDWLAHLAKTDDPEVFKFDYRFRYYEGDQSLQFEKSEDKKNWYTGTLNRSREDAIQVVRDMRKHLCEVDGDIPDEDCYELIREPDESPIQFMDRLREMPFSQSETITPEEARARGISDV
jgi:hypothetical protein